MRPTDISRTMCITDRRPCSTLGRDDASLTEATRRKEDV